MQEIAANLSSPAWWFSAVVIALFINLLSGYTKPWTDGVFSKLGGHWRTRTEARRKKLDAAVERRLVNAHLLRDSVERESRYRHKSVFMMLLALFMLFFGQFSGIDPKVGGVIFSPLIIGLLLLLMKLIGSLLTVGSIAMANSADRLEAIIEKTNILLVAAQDSHRGKLETSEHESNSSLHKGAA